MSSNQDRNPKAPSFQPPLAEMSNTTGHGTAATRGDQRQTPYPAPQQFCPASQQTQQFRPAPQQTQQFRPAHQQTYPGHQQFRPASQQFHPGPQQFHSGVSNGVPSQPAHANANASDDLRAPTVADILQVLDGTHPSSLMNNIIMTAQSNLAHLNRTYEYLMNARISPEDRDRIIKALRPKTLAAQQAMNARIKNAHDAGFKAAQTTAKAIYADVVKEVSEIARDQGFTAGVAAAQQMDGTARLEGVNTANSAELAKAQKVSEKQHEETSADLERALTQLGRSTAHLERCKDLFRDMVRARDAGDKHKLEALVAEADLAVWLSLDTSDDEDMTEHQG